MDISKFVSKTFYKHLKSFRPLEIWEQLFLVYHSDNSAKISAYKELLAECSDDYSREHLKRLISGKECHSEDLPEYRFIYFGRPFAIGDIVTLPNKQGYGVIGSNSVTHGTDVQMFQNLFTS